MQAVNLQATTTPVSSLKQSQEQDFQGEFDKKYISATEVIEFVGVTRPALADARLRGYVPGEIRVASGKVLVWERDFIMPFLTIWRNQVLRRQGQTTQ